MEENAFADVKEIQLLAHHRQQVTSWKPLLKARQATLIFEGEGPEESEILCLPFSSVEGFDSVFEPEINLDTYDERFFKGHSQDLKLRMALARMLYPFELSDKAQKAYQELLTKRAYPAQSLLVTGIFNHYGELPARWREVFALKPPQGFYAKELVRLASEAGQPAWVDALLALQRSEDRKLPPLPEEPSNDTPGRENHEPDFLQVSSELYRRCPQLRESLLAYQEQLKKGYPQGQSVRYLAHILFHELFGVWLKPEQDFLYELAADIAAEYMVDEKLGYETATARARQEIYDVIKRDYQVISGLYRQKGQRYLTHREALQFLKVEGQKNPQLIEEIRGLFTIGDAHPLVAGDNRSLSVETTMPRLAQDLFLAQIGQGILDDSGRSRQKGKQSTGLANKLDLVGEAGNLKRREGQDYQAFLRRFMVSGESRILDLDSFDPIYYTLGMEWYEDMPFIEPLETKEVLRLDELVIVIDTSGSCSGPMVRFFLEETWSVFQQEENFFDRFHVRILQCDNVVQQDVKLTTLEEAEHYMSHMHIHGGGDTDFRPAFRYIKRLQQKGELRRLKGIIYFTDGYGTFPQKGDAPKCETVFVSLRKQFDQVEVPVWAKRLLLTPPKGEDWATAYSGEFRFSSYNR